MVWYWGRLRSTGHIFSPRRGGGPLDPSQGEGYLSILADSALTGHLVPAHRQLPNEEVSRISEPEHVAGHAALDRRGPARYELGSPHMTRTSGRPGAPERITRSLADAPSEQRGRRCARGRAGWWRRRCGNGGRRDRHVGREHRSGLRIGGIPQENLCQPARRLDHHTIVGDVPDRATSNGIADGEAGDSLRPRLLEESSPETAANNHSVEDRAASQRHARGSRAWAVHPVWVEEILPHDLARELDLPRRRSIARARRSIRGPCLGWARDPDRLPEGAHDPGDEESAHDAEDAIEDEEPSRQGRQPPSTGNLRGRARARGRADM